MEKKTQQMSNPSPHDSMVLLVSGTPGAAEQFLKLEGPFSLFPLQTKMKTSPSLACLLREESWTLHVCLSWCLQKHLRELGM